jgi:predicted RNase H-like HicB family nuclease
MREPFFSWYLLQKIMRMAMALKHDKYTYRITWSEEDEEYVGLCAEFPSLSWLAATPEAALKGIRKVVTEIVRDMQAGGENVPESTCL